MFASKSTVLDDTCWNHIIYTEIVIKIPRSILSLALFLQMIRGLCSSPLQMVITTTGLCHLLYFLTYLHESVLKWTIPCYLLFPLSLKQIHGFPGYLSCSTPVAWCRVVRNMWYVRILPLPPNTQCFVWKKCLLWLRGRTFKPEGHWWVLINNAGYFVFLEGGAICKSERQLFIDWGIAAQTCRSLHPL